MSIANFKNFKYELNEHLNKLKYEIKILIYKEFKNYIFANRISTYHKVLKNFLTKAFCELTTYCYLKNFNKKIFNLGGYELIKEYLNNSQNNFYLKDFKNVVLISASKLSKNDEQINDFINYLMNNLKLNVWVKNLDWYNNEHYLEEVKLDKSLDVYQEELLKIIKSYDKDLFNLVSENKFKSIKLDFKDDWKLFIEKNVLNSLNKFLFTPIAYDEENYKSKLNKIFDLTKPNTIFIFINNIDVKEKYKTTLLNDLNFFSQIIKYDIPILTIDNNYFFSLLNPMSIEKFNNYQDLLDFLINKKNKKFENINELKNDYEEEQIDSYINNILQNEENYEIKDFKNNNDLLSINNSKEKNNLDKILEEHNSFEINEDFTELLTVITQENNLLKEGFPKKVTKDFKKFIKTFDHEINNIQLSSDNYDKDKYLNFRNFINQKNIDEVMDYLSNKIDNLIKGLQSKKMSKQDAMNYYALYIKIKSCLDEIEFLRLK